MWQKLIFLCRSGIIEERQNVQFSRLYFLLVVLSGYAISNFRFVAAYSRLSHHFAELDTAKLFVITPRFQRSKQARCCLLKVMSISLKFSLNFLSLSLSLSKNWHIYYEIGWQFLVHSVHQLRVAERQVIFVRFKHTVTLLEIILCWRKIKRRVYICVHMYVCIHIYDKEQWEMFSRVQQNFPRDRDFTSVGHANRVIACVAGVAARDAE